MTPAELALADIVVKTLNLEVAASDIDPDAPIYGEGLGLDSIDILQEARLRLYLCKFEEKNFSTPEQFLAYFIRVAERAWQ